MEFTATKENILKGLSKTQSIVERRNTMPILSNVLLKTSADNLTILATDLEVSFVGKIPVKVKSEGAVTVSARKLYEIIKEFPDESIDFKKDENNWLIVKCGNINFKIVGLSADEFPALPEEDGKDFNVLSKVILKDMIDKTLFAVSTEESRPNLTGICLETATEEEGGGLNVVATDGHRLALINSNINMKVASPIIVPRKGVAEIKKMLDDIEGDNVNLKIVGNNCIISADTGTLFIRLIDETFPNYRQVVPKGNDYKVVVNKGSLLRSLRRVSLLSTEKYKGVKLSVGKGKMTVSLNSSEYGEAQETIDIVSSPDRSMAIGLNAKYVMDVLDAMTEEEAVLELRDEVSQCVIKPHNNEKFVCVIMPMRL